MTEPYQLESDQNSYQSGLHDGRAARAREDELGSEDAAEPSIAGAPVGGSPAFLRGYRAGLAGD